MGVHKTAPSVSGWDKHATCSGGTVTCCPTANAADAFFICVHLDESLPKAHTPQAAVLTLFNPHLQGDVYVMMDLLLLLF